MNTTLRVILTILFNTASITEVILVLLSIAGMWKVFEKSSIPGWWALIPWAREYQIARCAGREMEGRIYCVTAFLITLSNLLQFLSGTIRSGMMASELLLFLVVEFSLIIVYIIYTIRIYSGMIELYGVRRRWMWLCMTVYTRFIPLLVWGFGRKYQPRWKVEDLRAEMARLASQGSAAALDEGLTVNLKERTVTEFFQKKTLLRDIHMAIPQGHMVLLSGSSGAGKSCYLNAGNGYEKADAQVLLNGTDLYKHYKKMQYDVGFVPQADMMRGKDTVLATLLDAAKLRLPKDVNKTQRRARVDEVMEIFGLKPVQSSLVEKLSGGQRKRLSISMEFISNPSLFILDEPDSGLDGVMARELFEQLRRIADMGKIVIVVTHTPDRVIDLFDDVIVLAKDSARTGRLAWYGSVEDARKFFGRERMEEIVKVISRPEEGGDGRADEFVMRYAEVQHA